MAYFSPYIDLTGMHIPTYADIRDELISMMKQIFGQDIYIDVDSQDYQQISIFAKKIYDTNSLALLTYNNRTANTAIGVGLDNLCALVGITRKPATYSTVQVTINGDAGTEINDGQISDGTNLWDLPAVVTIPSNGIITVQARSHSKGYVTALPNTLTTIVTPVYGWLGVTNNYQANPGVDEETDASLRERYAQATASPANTVFESMIASVSQVDGVSKLKAYENDTGETDDNGLPPHSVTFVVEGGDNTDIATEIYYKKTPGCYTNGDVEVNLTSEIGNVTVVRFYRPTYKTVYVKVLVKKLSGYNDNYATNIKNAIVEYIEGIEISEVVYRSILWSLAVGQLGSIQSPEFAVTDIQLSTDGSSYNTNDIAMLFNEVASTDSAKVTVEVS
jgi:uncharacterized phage protein gp47/JayE